MESLPGYRGGSLTLLKSRGVSVGDVVEVRCGESTMRGTLVPRYQYDDDEHIVVKLRSGYNVGIRVGSIDGLTRVSAGERPAFSSPAPPKPKGELPLVSILGTGGTIASRVDYRTGAVHPAISANDLYSLIPELSEVARIEPEIVLSTYSENLEPGDWTRIAEKAAQAVGRGARGVIVTTGTDFMGYTAAALSFALHGVPVPVLVVGSQRSSDRPSSDAYLNLVGAVSCAVEGDFSGVFVAMHLDSSDDRLALHRGTRVRKDHTSARDAFESVGVPPAASWSRSGLQPGALKGRGEAKGFVPKPEFDGRAALVKFYPSMPPTVIESLLVAGTRGLVIEGSGLGHVNRKSFQAVERCVGEGVLVCMTSQCIWGRVDMNVYDTGRDLLRAGVVPLEDVLPETALVKLMWVLAHSSSPDEAARMMRTNLAGEMTERSVPEA